MLEDTNVIEHLPAETQSKLRSTQILTSLPQIVSELVQNSLDAGATLVDVGLNCKEWMCWVRDDGHGIDKHGLEHLARGERYNTSKTYVPSSSSGSHSTFGFRGEALASAADISYLEICSRTNKSRNTWSIILKGTEALYTGPAVRWQRESAGTAVCIRDAFYNLPVRRLAHASPARTWELVRREIETYALIFPTVAFSIEDAATSPEGAQYKDRVVRMPKCASTIDVFSRLYGHTFTEHIHIVSEELGPTKIEGFISLTGAYSKIYQYLYINRHPVTLSELGREIDNQFTASSFGSQALDEEGDNGLPRSTIRRSPRKSEKKPVYVLNISLPPEEVDNCLDSTKSIVQLRNKSNVITLLSSAIQSFLKQNGFHNQDQMTSDRSASSSPSPRKRKKFNLDQSDTGEHDSMSMFSNMSLEGDTQGRVRKQKTDIYASTAVNAQEFLWMDPSTGERFVVDSRTGNSFPQTQSYVREHRENGIIDTRLEAGRRTIGHRKPNNLAVYNTDCPSSVPVWLEKALESNRAYGAAENRIPSVKVTPVGYHITLGHDSFQHDERGHNRSESSVISERFKPGKLSMRYESSIHRFTKDDLRHAEVISQVDRKFIACRITRRLSSDQPVAPNNEHPKDSVAYSDSTLVLIDQHAADERVRVEHFLKEICLGFLYSQDRMETKQSKGIRTTVLKPPRPVLLTQHEAHTINWSQDVQEMLRKWGVGFAEPSKLMPDAASKSGSSNAYSQLLVTSIPQVVSDKLIQGNELRDFIKGFLGQIQSGELFSDTQVDLPSEPGQEDDYLWLKAVRCCPKVLLDLINSKACRGAIMFNDSLSIDQCERLVNRLSKTAFPFQCAHGRPSFVPLVDIGDSTQGDKPSQRNRRRTEWARLDAIVDG